MSTYQMSWQEVWSELPASLGFALLESRGERLGACGINYVARSGLRAMRAMKEQLEEEYEIVKEGADHGR